jgi:hypothetical protein
MGKIRHNIYIQFIAFMLSIICLTGNRKTLKEIAESTATLIWTFGAFVLLILGMIAAFFDII